VTLLNSNQNVQVLIAIGSDASEANRVAEVG